MVLDNINKTSSDALGTPRSSPKNLDSPIFDPYTPKSIKGNSRSTSPVIGAGSASPSKQGKYAYNYFKQRGIPSHVAAGLVGNLQQESGVRALSYDDGANGPGGGGVAQWSPARYNGLKSFATTNKKDPRKIETQFDYILHELNTTESGAKKKIFATNNVDDATTAFQDYYFRPNKRMANTSNRVMSARGYEQYREGGRVGQDEGAKLVAAPSNSFNLYNRFRRKLLDTPIGRDFQKQYPTNSDKLSAVSSLGSLVLSGPAAIASAVVNTGVDLYNLHSENNRADLAANGLSLLSGKNPKYKAMSTAVGSIMDLVNPEETKKKKPTPPYKYGGRIKYAIGGSNLDLSPEELAAKQARQAGIGNAVGAGLGMIGAYIDSTQTSTPNRKKTVGASALTGAGSGAALGTSILPGWGTAIGAVVGGVAGLIGGGAKAKKQQREFDKVQMQAQATFMDQQQNRSAMLYRQQNPYTFRAGGRAAYFQPQFEVEKGEIMRGEFAMTDGKKIAKNIYKVGGVTHDQINPKTGTTGVLAAGQGDIYSNSLSIGGKTPAQLALKIAGKIAKVEPKLGSKNVIERETAQRNMKLLNNDLDNIFAAQESMKQYRYGGRVGYVQFARGGTTDTGTLAKQSEQALKRLKEIQNQLKGTFSDKAIKEALQKEARSLRMTYNNAQKAIANRQPTQLPKDNAITRAGRNILDATKSLKTPSLSDVKSVAGGIGRAVVGSGILSGIQSVGQGIDKEVEKLEKLTPTQRKAYLDSGRRSYPGQYTGAKPWDPFTPTIEERRAGRRAREAAQVKPATTIARAVATPSRKTTTKPVTTTTPTSAAPARGNWFDPNFDKNIREDNRIGNLRGGTTPGTVDPVTPNGRNVTDPLTPVRNRFTLPKIDPNNLAAGLMIGADYFRQQGAINRMETSYPVNLTMSNYYGYTDRSRLARHDTNALANRLINNPNLTVGQKQQAATMAANSINEINQAENQNRLQYDNAFADQQFRINASNNAILNQRNVESAANRNAQRQARADNFSNLVSNVNTLFAENQQRKLDKQRLDILSNAYRLKFGDDFVNDRVKYGN